jgi:putative endonuclease
MNTKKTGKTGERITSTYLRFKGYSVINRNFVFRAARGPNLAEIDIVAKKGDCFVFVEVKTIFANAGYLAQDKVDQRKLWKIAKAAEAWLAKNKIPLDSKWRIDVVAVEFLPDNRPEWLKFLFGPKCKISHFENAASG